MERKEVQYSNANHNKDGVINVRQSRHQSENILPSVKKILH